MTIEDRIKKCIGRHPDWDNVRISKSTAARIPEIEAVRAGGAIVQAPDSAAFVSLDKVIARYDVKSAILREISALPKGKLIVESELCQRTAGNDRNRFRRTVENNAEELRPFRIKLKLDDSSEGKWFWARSDDIKEALRIVSL